MQEKYINAAAVKLIENLGYMPIKNEHGEMVKNPIRQIIVNSAYGRLIVVELINGDMLTLDGMKELLDFNQNRLKSVNKKDEYSIYEVFVFSETPDNEKLNIIEAGQYKKLFHKGSLSCFTLDLSKKEIVMHFRSSKLSSDIYKILKSVILSDYESADDAIDLSSLAEKAEEEYTLKYAADKTPLTIGLIFINIAVWIIMMLYSQMNGLDYNYVLNLWGAKENLSIMTGEYWRFVTPIFCHVNLVHLLINCYSLYCVGMITEKLYGHVKFLFIYFAAGIFGNILSFMFSPNPGAGASGAIFGLLGAMLYFGVENPVVFRRYFGYNVITTIIINIAYGFSQPGIDNYAHIGGLLGGFLTSGIVKTKETSALWLKRSVFTIVTLAVLISFLFYGFNNNQNTSLLQLDQLEDMVKINSWVEAEKLGLEIISKNQKNDDIRFRALWILVVADASQEKYDDAFKYADQVIEIDSARGHYIKGLLYAETRQNNLAKKELEEAKMLNPDLSEAVDDILKTLNE